MATALLVSPEIPKSGMVSRRFLVTRSLFRHASMCLIMLRLRLFFPLGGAEIVELASILLNHQTILKPIALWQSNITSFGTLPIF